MNMGQQLPASVKGPLVAGYLLIAALIGGFGGYAAVTTMRRVNQGETRVDLDETLPYMACRTEGGARLRAGHERRRFLKPLLAVG